MIQHFAIFAIFAALVVASVPAPAAIYELPPDMRDRLARGERGAIAEPSDEAKHG